MSGPHILIAGAGIAGIVAALALVQKGFEVSLYEQALELHELGAGLQISPNGARVHTHLLLRDTLKQIEERNAALDERTTMLESLSAKLSKYLSPRSMRRSSPVRATWSWPPNASG